MLTSARLRSSFGTADVVLGIDAAQGDAPSTSEPSQPLQLALVSKRRPGETPRTLQVKPTGPRTMRHDVHGEGGDAQLSVLPVNPVVQPPLSQESRSSRVAHSLLR